MPAPGTQLPQGSQPVSLSALFWMGSQKKGRKEGEERK